MIDKNTVITIVGLGLLGGSYAQAFARAGYDVKGIDIDEDAVSFAKEQGWITEGSTDVSLAADTDILICALYPHVFISWVKENQHLLKPGTLITEKRISLSYRQNTIQKRQYKRQSRSRRS